MPTDSPAQSCTPRPCIFACGLKLVVSMIVALGIFAPPALLAQDPPPTGSWSVTMGVQELLESNAAFSATDSGEDDLGSKFQVAAGRIWPLRRDRGSLSLSGDVSQLVYLDTSSLNQFAYGAGAAGSFAMTRRLLWTLSDNVTSTYAQDSRVLTETGLLFPKVLTKINTAATQFSYDWSPRTQVRVGLTHQRISFDSESLIDSTNATVSTSMTRQLSRTQSVGVSFGHTISRGSTGDIQGLLGTWQAGFGNRYILAVSGGVRPYKLTDDSPYQFTPGGSVRLTGGFGRGGTFEVNYEKAVEQAYGVATGTHLADRYGARTAIPLGTSVSVDGSVYYGSNSYPLQPDLRLDGLSGSIGASYQVRRNLSVVGSYAAWQRRTPGQPNVTTDRTSVSLSYRLSSR